MYINLRCPRTPVTRTFARSLPLLVAILCIQASGAVMAAPVGEGPDVRSLLDLCARGAARGGRGVEAAGCEWFAAPCACKFRGAPGEGEPWCVPEAVTVDEEVRAVITELRRLPDNSVPAEGAVAAILGRLYPCPVVPDR